MAWTEDQKKAIDLEGKNIIVSAGAGSGKTAVLTARVQRKLLSGIHVNELLVLTFTNAAAAEMKDRIRKTIRETPGLEGEANLIDGAYITTFDSFSLSMVKKYHTRLNVTSQIQIADEVLIEMKKREILDTIFDEHYLSPKRNFTKLIHDFCLKDDKDLKEAILRAYQKIELKYDKEVYLREYSSKEMNDEKISMFLQEYRDLLKEKQATLQETILSLNDYFDGDFVGKIEDNFQKLCRANTYSEFLEGTLYQSITVPRNSDPTGKKLKQKVFDIASEIKDLCLYESEEEMREEILSTRDSILAIVEILQELDARLDRYKFSEELFNFTDISRLAIRVVLENEDIREEIQNSFQEILVDEYQDTSDTQEMFISLISRNNVYMVGDIKQSIYRFRNANPSIFKNKYDTYRDTDLGEKIDLLKNFRSREEVLKGINLLFNLFMDDTLGGAAYQESHQMVFGNQSYIQEGKTEQNYDLSVFTYSKENLGKLSMSEEEAFLIGSDIQKKIREKFLVFDKDLKVLRPIEYRDFVILLDKSRDFDLYKKIFEYLHIPLTILKDESLKKEDDILVIRNLLRFLICIREKRFDEEFRYTFTSLSRSFLLPTKDADIYDVFANDKFLESELYQKCLPLVEEMDTMNLSQYFLFLLDEFQYEEKILTVGNVRYLRVRMEYLYRLCQDYERKGNTIYDFVSYLNEIFEGDYDLKFNISSHDNNSCKIMTIHKSKGLEFPICYFAGFSSRFNMSELKERILFDNQYGFLLPKVEESYKDTILKTLLKVRTRREEISEKIRLLYVALTRAKEKMIIVMPEMEEEEETFSMVPLYEREKYHSFLSIMKSIYSVLLPYIEGKDITGSKDYLIVDSSMDESFEKVEDRLKVEELSLPTNVLEEKHYSKESLSIPTEEERELMEFGTKVHAVLEEIDFSHYDLGLYDLSDFVRGKIEAFLQSDFMKDKRSMKAYKEYEFLYQEENVLSHGIIDLLLEGENNIVLVDYKLKNIDDELYDRQLNGYRKAISKKTGKEVTCYLYSIMMEEYREVIYD